MRTASHYTLLALLLRSRRSLQKKEQQKEDYQGYIEEYDMAIVVLLIVIRINIMSITTTTIATSRRPHPHPAVVLGSIRL